MKKTRAHTPLFFFEHLQMNMVPVEDLLMISGKIVSRCSEKVSSWNSIRQAKDGMTKTLGHGHGHGHRTSAQLKPSPPGKGDPAAVEASHSAA